MSKTKVILTLTFLLVFAAGAVVGMVRNRVAVGPHGVGPHGGDPNSFFTRELSLSPDQADQMKKIWSDLGPGRPGERDHWDRRREYQKQRDDAIRALLSPEQLTKYDAIRKEYDDHVADLSKERQAAFQQAVEKTKAVLTPEQFAKFESFRNRRHEGGGPGGGSGGPGGGTPQWRGGDRDRRNPDAAPSTRHAD